MAGPLPRIIGCLSAFFCAFCGFAQGQTTWTGSAGTLWGSSSNWTSGVPGTGITASFGDGGNGNVAIDLGGVSRSIGTIFFDNQVSPGAAAYTFSGNAGDAFVFDANGTITVSTPVSTSQTFNTPLQLLGAFTVSNNTAAATSLTLNGNISLAAGGTAGLLTVTGLSNTTINGSIGTGIITGLTKTGVGSLTLGGANTFLVPTTLSGGTILLKNALALQNSPVTVNVANGLVFDSSVAGNAFTIGGLSGVITTGNVALVNNAATPAPIALTLNVPTGVTLTQSGGLTGAGSLIKTGPGTQILGINTQGGGQNTFTGGTIVNGGILQLTATNSPVGVIRGTLTVNTGGTVSMTTANATGYAGGQKVDILNVNGGTVLSSGGGDQGWGITVNLTGGTMTASSGQWSLGGGSVVNTIASTATSVINGTIVLREGNQQKTDPLNTAATIATLVFNVASGNPTTGTAGVDLVVAGNLAQNNSAFWKDGPGVMRLNTVSSNTRGTTVNQGVLQLNTSGATGTLRGTVWINTGAKLQLLNGDTMGYTTGLSTININGGTLDKTGTGSDTLGTITAINMTGGTWASTTAGSSFNNNSTTIVPVNVLASATTSLISANLQIRNAGYLFTVASGTTPSGVDLLVSGAMTRNANNAGNTFGVDKEGPGVMVMTGVNAYVGATRIGFNSGVGGTLQLGDGTASGAFATASEIQIANGVFALNPGTAGVTLGSAVSGVGDVKKLGPNTVTLTGAISYTGNTNINGGTLRFQPSTTVNSSASVSVADTATLRVSSFAVASQVLSTPTLTFGTATGGNVRFDLIGVPTIAPLAATSALTANGTNTINVTSTTQISGQFPLIAYPGSIGGGGFGSFTLGTLPLRVVANLVNNTANSTIDLNVTGSDTIKWNGLVNSSWDIGTITGSTITSGTANWTAIIANASTVYLQPTAPGDIVTFDNTATTFTVNAVAPVNPTSITVNNSAANPYTFTGAGVSSIALTKTGDGNMKILNDHTYTSTINIGASSIVTIGDGVATTGSITFTGPTGNYINDGSLVYNRPDAVTLVVRVTGAGTLTQNGAGTLTVSTQQFTTGGTTVNAGILRLTAGGGIGAVRGTLNINAGATVQLSGTDILGYVAAASSVQTINITGGTLDKVTSAQSDTMTGVTVNMTGGLWASSFAGSSYSLFTNAAIPTPGTINILPSPTTATISANLQLRTYSPVFTVATGTTPTGVDLLVSGTITMNAGATGPFGITKEGSGTMVLTGTNTYTGATTINVGSLQLGDGTTSGSLVAATAITNNAAFVLNPGIAGVTIASPIGGTGTLVKVGPNQATLTSSLNNYTGITSVSAGTLRIKPTTTATYTSTINVADSAKLGVASFDTISTALSVPTLNLGSTTGGQMNFELVGNTTLAPLAVTTAFTTTGVNALNISSSIPLTVGSFPLIAYPTAISGAGFAGLTLGLLPPRVVANLVNNTANSTVVLQVSSIDAIRWNGTVNGNWDINTTQNWKTVIGLADTVYLQPTAPGDAVAFNDLATGVGAPAFAVNVVAPVSPFSITIDNNTNTYTFAGAAITGTANLVKSGTGSATFNNVLTYTGTTTLNNGTLVMSGNNTLPGAISVAAGTLTLSGNNALSTIAVTTGTVTLSGTNTLTSLTTSGGTTTLAGANTFTGGIAVNGGTVSLGGAQTTPGNVTIAAGGQLNVGTGGAAGSFTGTINVDGVLNFNRSDAYVFGTVIPGAGEVKVSNPVGGSVQFTSLANSFTGNLTVVSGTLIAANALNPTASTTSSLGAQLSTRQIIVNSGATLSMPSNNTFFGGGGATTIASTMPTLVIMGTVTSTRYNALPNIVLTGGTLTQSATDAGGYEGYQFMGTITVTGTTPSTISTGNGKANHLQLGGTTFDVADIGGGATALTVSAPMRDGSGDYPGQGSLYKNGAGTMVLSAANTYTGFTQINTGVLQLGDGVTNGSVAGLIFNDSVLRFNPGTTNQTFATAIQSSGSVEKTGPNTLTLTGNSSYAGSTTVAGGRLRVGPNTLPGGTTLNVRDAGIFTPFNTTATSVIVSTLNLGSTTGAKVNFELVGNTAFAPLTATTAFNTTGVNSLNISTTQSFVIGQFPLIQYPTGGPIGGAGFAGLTLGTIPLRVVASLVNNTAASTVDLNIIGIDVPRWNGNVNSIWDINTTLNWRTTVSNVPTTYLQPTIPGDTVLFNNQATGALNVIISTTVSPAAMTVDNDTSHNYSFAGSDISGTTSITKSGTGSLTLSNSNTYTGGTVLNAGTLLLNQVSPIGSGLFTINGGTFDNIFSAPLTLTNTQVWGGNINFTGTNALTINGGATMTGNRNVAVLASSLTIGGAINDGGSGFSLTKTGNGSLTLGGFNTYSGGTTVNAGSLTLTAGNNGTGAVIGTLTINAAGTVLVGAHDVFGYNNAATTLSVLNINGGLIDKLANTGVNETLTGVTVNMTGGTLAGTGGYWDLFTNGYGDTTFNILNSPVTATISAALNYRSANTVFTVTRGTAPSGVDVILSGILTGPFGMTKEGNGNMLVSGVNTYTGPTTINAGTYTLTGSLAAGTAVTVAGGTLAGTGTIAGTVAVNTGVIRGGTGTNLGTLTVGTTTFSNTGTLLAALGTNTNSSKLALGINSLNFVTGTTLSLLGAGFTQQSSTYTLATLSDGNNITLDSLSVADHAILGTYIQGQTVASPITFDLTNLGVVLSANDQFVLSREGNLLVLSFSTVVPEPGLLLVFGAGLVTVTLRRRGRGLC